MIRHALLVIMLAAGLTGGTAAAQSAKNDYASDSSWLCRPGRQDACASDLTTTVVAAKETMARETWKANLAAPIDCFYVYPTVSSDPTPNSDMIADAAEKATVRSQFARFGSQCRTYAPMYRQVTLAALRAGIAGTPMTPDRVVGYNDVVDAGHYYLDHDNNGRGVVLVGHSQGTGVLTRLIRSETDGKPVQSRIMSALLLGTSLPVPRGKDVGGAFQHLPLCRSAQQTGCVIAYASFRSTIPPPPDTRFGKVQGEHMESACTNPAAPAGGSAPLHAYLAAAGRGVTGSTAEPVPWVTPAASIETPFVSVPGLLTAQCVSNDKGSYLEVTVHGDPSDPRTDDISGDVFTNGQLQANWGLHVIDVNLAMGNLVDIVGQQAQTYLAAQKKE